MQEYPTPSANASPYLLLYTSIMSILGGIVCSYLGFVRRSWHERRRHGRLQRLPRALCCAQCQPLSTTSVNLRRWRGVIPSPDITSLPTSYSDNTVWRSEVERAQLTTSAAEAVTQTLRRPPDILEA